MGLFFVSAYRLQEMFSEYEASGMEARCVLMHIAV